MVSCLGVLKIGKNRSKPEFLTSRHAFDDLYHSIDVNGDDSIAIDEFIWYCKRRVREISFGISYLLRFFSLKLIQVQRILFYTFSHCNDFEASSTTSGEIAIESTDVSGSSIWNISG